MKKLVHLCKTKAEKFFTRETVALGDPTTPFIFGFGCITLSHDHQDEQASSIGSKPPQAAAMLFAKCACPLANSCNAIPISAVFCSWKRSISSFIIRTMVSNLLVASSLSAFNCSDKNTHSADTTVVKWEINQHLF